ncbi:MAG: hypothetical protein KDA58_08215 [Planctomycetaceae bacterium]|nr:hypothetical protein [Planctomycetaceae bacterium]
MNRKHLSALTLVMLLGFSWTLADDSRQATEAEQQPAASAADSVTEPSVGATPEADSTEAADAEPANEGEIQRVSLEVARDRASLMHDIYLATLDAIHHRYFHGDRAVIPARAMEDVFKELKRQHHFESRWIGASFTAMSIDHEPKTEFEKDSSRQLAKGTEFVETIEDGYYRRAGSVPFTGGCISCHSGLFAATSTRPKFAGLVISIPVTPDAMLPPQAPTVDSTSEANQSSEAEAE